MARIMRAAVLAAALLALTSATAGAAVTVATNDVTYTAFGRAFPDPQGCGPSPTGVVVSPWAKGNVCAAQFLTFDEVVEGSEFLARKHSRFLQVMRLDEAFDDESFKSAGLPQTVGVDEDGKPEVLSRAKRPLYLMKVTDARSPIPERDREHFVYSLSIHGIERAGVEGGVRAMEDLVTWAACESDPASAPACPVEGPFPKRIVETRSDRPSPTAGDTLRRSVVYFMLPNPDGWHRGEVQNGDPSFQRYNGNGVDLNRDWPTVGYTYRPYSPGSEPETKAFAYALRTLRDATTKKAFTGGIDLHGQLTAGAYSYTLLGAGQRDFRKNFATVDQSLRAWEDQTQRLAWSPYLSDRNANGRTDSGEVCALICVADQWGTVVDTIAYQITGGVGDWFESDIGLRGVGIDNEMSLSHLAPNIVFDPTNEQMHVDGNKGLIYSQIASMLTKAASQYRYAPPGKIGYVRNPKRISDSGSARGENPGYPSQNDIDTLVPCALDCDGATFARDATNAPVLEFEVLGPDRGIWNGGLTVTAEYANVQGVSPSSATVSTRVEHFVEGQWQPVAQHYQQEATYLSAGQIVTVDDPSPGRWRVRISTAAGLPARIKVDFRQVTAEENPGQRAFSASSMDFFDDLNRYVTDPAKRAEAVTVRQVIDEPRTLQRFDSLVVVNEALPAYSDAAGTPLGLTAAERQRYFDNLRGFAAAGGNLVLTDGALRGLEQLGLVPGGSVTSSQPSGRGAVPRIQFNVSGRRNLCTPEEQDVLVRDVCLPGSAGGTARQVMEPAPLGYTPDATLDGASVAKITQYHVSRAAWEQGCGKPSAADCTSGLFGSGTALGERVLGNGVVRVAGAMFPDPNFAPGGPRDMRFGLSSYSLTFSGWQVFLNLVNYRRPAPLADMWVTLTDSPDPVTVTKPLTWTLRVRNNGPAFASGARAVLSLPPDVRLSSVPAGCSAAGTTVVCTAGFVDPGAERSFAITGLALAPGSVQAGASVTALEADPNEGNDVAQTSTSATCTVTGTAGDDLLKGGDGADVVCGLGGNDSLKGLDGDDVLVGGAGDDVLEGFGGNDWLLGGTGRDELDGGTDFDRCEAAPGPDGAVVGCEQ
ncbi:MAG TPA: M14 family zinc carboxypeptidase [Solirubrobacteraceae bacterium]|nr:M14 family zinc carboxypeptidase [Solirubrobacteraceae bacterium]